MLCHTGTGRPKRVRTNYSSDQLSELENFFKTTRYLSRPNRIEMAKRLKLNERQVKIWFQNRRMKEKRDQAKSKAQQNRSISPSQSLTSNASSPSSHRSSPPAPLPNFQMTDQDIRDNLLELQNYNYFSVVPKSEPQETVPVYEPFAVPAEQQAPNTPAKIESNDQVHIFSAENFVDEVKDFAQHYGFIAMQDENQTQLNGSFSADSEEQPNSPIIQEDLNKSANFYDFLHQGLVSENVYDPYDLPNVVSSDWTLCPEEEVSDNILTDL